MSSSTDIKSLEFVESAGVALAAAEKMALDVNTEKQAAVKLAGPLAESMVSAQLVETLEQPLLLQKLASHDGAVEVIGNLVTHIANLKKAYAQKLAVAQGGGSPTDGDGLGKAASAGGSQNGNGKVPFVGQRAGLGEKRASDESLRRLAGLGS